MNKMGSLYQSPLEVPYLSRGPSLLSTVLWEGPPSLTPYYGFLRKDLNEPTVLFIKIEDMNWRKKSESKTWIFILLSITNTSPY